jgi:hypothetical protein
MLHREAVASEHSKNVSRLAHFSRLMAETQQKIKSKHALCYSEDVEGDMEFFGDEFL